jgi:hypothetical protein
MEMEETATFSCQVSGCYVMFSVDAKLLNRGLCCGMQLVFLFHCMLKAFTRVTVAANDMRAYQISRHIENCGSSSVIYINFS